MRLLNRQEIATAKASERSKEIAEGLKISRRVDSLRELQANEEASLDKFRIETLSEIKKEISDANSLKESLLAELSALRKEKADGLKDVEAGLKKIAYEKSDIDTREKIITDKLAEILNKEKALQANLTASQEESRRARTQLEDAEKLHQVAFDAKEGAIQSLTRARQAEEEATRSRNESEREILIKRQEIEAQRQELSKKQSALDDFSVSLRNKDGKLSERSSELDRIAENHVIDANRMVEREKELALSIEDAKNELERARTHKEEAIRLHQLADDDRLEAQNVLKEAKKTEKRIQDEKAASEKFFLERDAEMRAQEAELSAREEEDKKLSDELTQKAVQLNDQRVMLDRALRNAK